MAEVLENSYLNSRRWSLSDFQSVENRNISSESSPRSICSSRRQHHISRAQISAFLLSDRLSFCTIQETWKIKHLILCILVFFDVTVLPDFMHFTHSCFCGSTSSYFVLTLSSIYSTIISLKYIRSLKNSIISDRYKS